MATEFFAGMCGGAAGIVVGQPFDTLKVLQQTDVSGKKTLYETFRKSVSKNGYLGLFDGMATPLIGAQNPFVSTLALITAQVLKC